MLAALPAVLFGCGGSLICVRGLTRICKKCEHYTFVRTALRCPREQTGRKTYFLVEINGQMRHTRRIFNTAGVGTPAVDCYGDRTAVVGHNPKTGEVVVIRHFTAEERSKNFEVG